MTKTKIITLVVIFILFMLPGFIMLYGSMFFNASFSEGTIISAGLLFFIGFIVMVTTAIEMDNQ